jgi:hypothetical protein
MASNFEALWEECENLQKDAAENTEVKTIIDEMMMKIGLYKTVDAQISHITEEERPKVKSRAFGEILLMLTCLSMKEQINVFESLAVALQYRKIQHLDKKNPA